MKSNRESGYFYREKLVKTYHRKFFEMPTGDNLKREGRPSMLQIRCLQELKRLQPVGRGFQVVIAEKCHISAPGINKSLKKAIEYPYGRGDHGSGGFGNLCIS